MRHPCKKCLVRPSCSLECKEWKIYSSQAAQLISGITLIVGGLITGATLIWLNHIAETTGEEWPQMVIVFIWIFSFMAVTIIQSPNDKNDQIGFFTGVIFGPMMLIWIVVIQLTKRYFQRA